MSEKKLVPARDSEFSGVTKFVDPDGRQDTDNAKADGQRQPPPIASREDCMRALTQLAGLIAMKVLKPAEANAIRGVYGTLLQQYQKDGARQEQKLSDDNVLEILRQNPSMLSLLEPLLTQEQVNMVMQDATDGDDG